MPRRNFIGRAMALVGAGALIDRVAGAAPAPQRVAGGSPFTGEITIVAFGRIPLGWAACDGQFLQIADYPDLFALIGTTYGGDGETTFALPNLNGRAPTHQGTGPGLTSHDLGEPGGAEVVTLLTSQLPAHSHAMRADSALGTSDTPAGNYPARNAAGVATYGTDNSAFLGSATIATTGSNQAHDNMQPYLAMSYIIALTGIDPNSV